MTERLYQLDTSITEFVATIVDRRTVGGVSVCGSDASSGCAEDRLAYPEPVRIDDGSQLIVHLL